MRLSLVSFALVVGLCWSAPVPKVEVDSKDLAKAVQQYLELAPDRQAVYRQYFSGDVDKFTAEKLFRFIIKMRVNDPDIYEVYKGILAATIKKVKDKTTREFVEWFYFDRMEQVPDNSDQEYEKFIKDVAIKIEKLDPEAAKKMNDALPGVDQLTKDE